MMLYNDTPEIFSHPVHGVIDQSDENLLRVRALGSIWTAQLHMNCRNVWPLPGQVVTVIGRIGIQLIIVPQDDKI